MGVGFGCLALSDAFDLVLDLLHGFNPLLGFTLLLGVALLACNILASMVYPRVARPWCVTAHLHCRLAQRK
jgi:hypothetical protein